VDTLLGWAKRAGAVGTQGARPPLNLARWLSKKRRPIKRTNPHSTLEVKMKKKKTLLLWALLLVVLALEGCATVRGIAEDIQNLGRGLKRTVSE
jgi:predicted small secreted protein